MSNWNAMTAILRKDILLELRLKNRSLSTLLFALLLTFLASLYLSQTRSIDAEVFSGTLWLIFTFIGTLILTRTYSIDEEQGGLRGIIMTGVTPESILLQKTLFNWLWISLVDCLVLPLFALLNDQPILLILAEMIGIILLVNIGFAVLGTFIATMFLNQRLLALFAPIVFYPLCFALIIPAIHATSALVRGSTVTGFVPIIAFDLIFCAAALMLFSFLLEDDVN